MKLNKIEMNNFLPFYIHTEMDFSPKGRNKIVLLQGVNGAGKSSTFTALNFVFFGEGVTGVGQNQTLPIHDLVNTKRISESDGTAYVRVHFQHETENWNFTRKINFKKIDTKRDQGMSSSEYAKKIKKEKMKNVTMGEFIAVRNGVTEAWPTDPVPRDRAQRELIDNIIPKDSSKYYFFDGEEISKYTTVPPEDSIKNLIEKLLGIKMVDNAIKDLTELKEQKYDKEIRKLGRENKQTKSLAIIAEDKKILLDMMKKTKINKDKEIEHLTKQIITLTAKLDADKEIKIKLDRIGDITKELDENEQLLTAEEKSLNQYHGDSLPILLAVTFLSKINMQKTLQPRQQAHITQTATDCLKHGTCICKRHLDENAKDELKQLAKSNSSGLENFEEAASAVLGPYGMNGLTTTWKTHLDEIFRYKQQIKRLTREKDEIDRIIDVESHSSVEIEESRVEHNNAKEGLLFAKKEANELEKIIDVRQLEYNDAFDKVRNSNVSIALTEFNAKSKRCQQMIKGFDQAKENVVKTQKKAIEDFATDILKKITTGSGGDPRGLQRLHLDETYTIMIERYVGAPQYTNDSPIPSQGEKQIIAMAFVLALTKFAGIERPIFIDTPFARLDNEYTQSLANAIIEQDEQVIILYQPGELNHDGIQKFRERCASEWEIIKLSVDSSVVEEIQ